MTSPSRGRSPAYGQLDAVTYLTVYLVLLVGIESRMVIGPLGGAGSPATLMAVGGLCWWMFYQVQKPESREWMAQPVRLAMLGLFLAFLASFAVAMSRPIAGTEVSTANLGMVSLGAWLGVCLLANDGIPSLERFTTISRRLVVAGTLMALVGLAQFITQDLLIRSFTIPGLTTSAPLSDLAIRNGFTRPAGTALHPIEFGAVLTIVLPIAVSYARTVPTARVRAWASVAVIGFGIILSGSRSAFLCAIVGLLLLSFVWPLRVKVIGLVTVAVMIGFVILTVPGMTGTVLKLFTGVGSDDSVASRTGSYPLVGQFTERQPLFGRGYSTFLPSYRILDNQYLLLLIEVGTVGLVAFFFVLIAAMQCARNCRKYGDNLFIREQGQAYLAAIAAAAVGLATFDGLGFPQVQGSCSL